ncbi:MAG: SH3 domain-containing protein [Spirochaetaceae bacterium]|nr:SH3 domain-containing protein [Spirochaetaceae bacterium]
MRKIWVFLLFIVMNSHLSAEKLKISQDANLRSEPNKNSKSIKVLLGGTICEGELFQDNNDWYKVIVDGDVGFVHKSLINTPFSLGSFTKKHPLLMRIAFIIFLIIIIKMGRNSKCPRCNKWFAEIKLSKNLIDSEGHYSTIDRTDIKRNSQGEKIGTIERKEQVHMTTDIYRQNCKCRFCGYKYSYKTRETYEG